MAYIFHRLSTIHLICISILIFILTSITYSLISLRYGYSSNGDTTNWALIGGIGPEQVSFRIRLVPPMPLSFIFSLSISKKGTSSYSNIGDEVVNINFSRQNAESTSMYTYVVDPTNSATNTNIGNTTNATEAIEVTINTMWTHETTGETIWSLQFNGLEPQTKYDYNVFNVDNTNDIKDILLQGTYHTTAPVNTRYNFSIVTAGCSHTGSNHPIFHHLNEEEDVQMMIHLGDFHYGDIAVNDMALRLQQVSTTLSASYQNKFYASTPMVSIWDDHDWLGNDSGNNTNSDGSVEAGAHETALQSYQIAFPHYPLELLRSNDTVDINTTGLIPVSPYHAFTVGTVRFIITDLRSESSTQSMMSAQQELWLYSELRNASSYDYVVWVSSKPWIGEDKPGKEAWYGHVDKRAALSSYISQSIGGDNDYNSNGSNDITAGTPAPPRNLLVVSADAHMVAFDNGQNTFYGESTTQNYSFPILQTGPLDRIGSKKGGPAFTHGCYGYTSERTNQYSRVSFEFPSNGSDSEPCIAIESYRVHSVSHKEVIFQHKMCGKIFNVASAEYVGSCDMEGFRTGSTVLLSFSMIFTIIAMLVPCLYPLLTSFLDKKKTAKSSTSDPKSRNNEAAINHVSQLDTNDGNGYLTNVPTTSLESSPTTNDGICNNCCARYERLYIAILVFLGFGLTLAAGVYIPFIKRIPIFTLRPYAVIALVQSIVLLLILAIYCNKSRNTTTIKATCVDETNLEAEQDIRQTTGSANVIREENIHDSIVYDNDTAEDGDKGFEIDNNNFEGSTERNAVKPETMTV